MTRELYETRITLKHVDPPIWRTVLVDGNIRLDMLHDVIQAAMGWEDAHLHAFHSKGKTYMPETGGEFEPSGSTTDFTLRDLAPHEGDHIEYEYDFGDGWQHEISVMRIAAFDAHVNAPAVIDGENACPPEDCGGSWGFADMLAAFQDEHHPDHDEIVDWLGVDFNPEFFDIKEANQRLSELE
jgi:hypothetical protein